jgi:hypothetical protein
MDSHGFKVSSMPADMDGDCDGSRSPASTTLSLHVRPTKPVSLQSHDGPLNPTTQRPGPQLSDMHPTADIIDTAALADCNTANVSFADVVSRLSRMCSCSAVVTVADDNVLLEFSALVLDAAGTSMVMTSCMLGGLISTSTALDVATTPCLLRASATTWSVEPERGSGSRSDHCVLDE